MPLLEKAREILQKRAQEKAANNVIQAFKKLKALNERELKWNSTTDYLEDFGGETIHSDIEKAGEITAYCIRNFLENISSHELRITCFKDLLSTNAIQQVLKNHASPTFLSDSESYPKEDILQYLLEGIHGDPDWQEAAKAIMLEDEGIQNHLYESGSRWIFNPPHSSHMGGIWERMIGITRRI